MAKLKSSQLLEINIISAQDLEPVSKKMKTYVIAWVHPTRKLSTRVDDKGYTNPTWNDKFVFRVDEEFLQKDSSAVMIEIRSGGRWFGDVLIGTVRVLVGNLVPPPIPHNHHHNHHHLGMRFVALQVRRPSGRPQGILNIGVALLDSSIRSMPLYTHLSTSAVGYRDLMEEEEDHHHHRHHHKSQHRNSADQNRPSVLKPILRRSKSERSERVTFDDNISVTTSSMVAVPQKNVTKENDILNLNSGYDDQSLPLKVVKGKNGKANSVVSGAELKEKRKSKGRKCKSGSALSDSVVSKDAVKGDIKFDKPIPIVIGPGRKIKLLNDKLGPELSEKPTDNAIVGNGKPMEKFIGNGYEFGGPKKGSSILSGSEVGPSPSEVAAAIAERRYPLDEEKSSVLDGWSVDESVEGLRSKLERWRTELPPLYDGGFSSTTFRSSTHHARRHTDGGNGLFQCFGNIFGYECQCVCGRPPSRERPNSGRFRSP